MTLLKRLVLDVLKPHQPNVLEFATSLAEVGDDYQVVITVLEVDENTETVQIEIDGSSINFTKIQSAITDMSGSLHSIDVVEVLSAPASSSINH